MKKALITGVAGQDGSYLADLLLEKGYEVHGLVRSGKDAQDRYRNIAHLRDSIQVHRVDVENPLSVYKVVDAVRPDECYHLAGFSFVSYSFDEEHSIINTNFNGTHNVLSALKDVVPGCRLYFAGTSEMFGSVETSPQGLTTPFNPRSIYGISKLSGYHLVRNYRKQYGMFVCTGILYNHESPRRSEIYLPRKISLSAARIKLGLDDKIYLGNIDAKRDWGYAPEYVEAMWKMLQLESPRDFVIGTGVLHSVRQLLEIAFSHVGLNYADYLEIDDRYFRPSELIPLCADASVARQYLGWEAQKPFREMIEEMVDADLQSLQSR